MKVMEENRAMPLIIERGHLQGAGRRAGQWLMTALLWGFWLYLMMPMFGFVPSVSEFLAPFIRPLDTEVILGLAVIVGLLIAGLGLWMGLWAKYNILLHRLRPRDRRADVVRSASLARHFHVCPVDLAAWQRGKQLVIRHCEQGGIRDVIVREAA